MRVKSFSLGILATMVLAACGGGGGGSEGPTAGVSSVAPAAVAITEATAKPVAANATEAAQGGAAAGQSTLGVLGVQLEGEQVAVAPHLLWVVGAAQTLTASKPGASGALGVAIDESKTCPAGTGSVRITGNIANPHADGPSPGDVLTLTASNCRVTVSGVTNTMNGTVTMKFNSYSSTRANLTLTADALSVQTAAGTVVTTGDQTLDVATTSASTTLVVSGSSVKTSVSTGTGTRTTTWKNFSHNYVVNSSAVTASVSGNVESDSAKLGSGGGSYTVSTPTRLSWNPSTGGMTGGVMKIVGASSSQMQITYSSTGAVITVDANADGTYEKTVNATAAELKSLL